MYDCHNHTSFSLDSKADIYELVESAIKVGLKGITITDHIEVIDEVAGFETRDINGNRRTLLEYRELLIKVREKYKDEIDVLIGGEVGAVNTGKGVQSIQSILNDKDLDFTILSTHMADGCPIHLGCNFFTDDKIASYDRYLKSILESVKIFENFQVYGHLDYITRYSNYADNNLHYNEHKEIIDEILKIIIKKDCGLDVNTSGRKYGREDLNPQMDILKRYKELGGKILTLGSDSHGIDRVGDRFDFACDCLKSCGFTEATYFRNRIPNFYKI